MISKTNIYLTGAVGFQVMCNKCGLLLTEEGKSDLIIKPTAAEAQQAAQSAGWHIISRSQARCPRCKEKRGRQ